MTNKITNSNIHINSTDNIVKHKDFTIIESYSGDITAEDFLKQVVVNYTKNN